MGETTPGEKVVNAHNTVTPQTPYILATTITGAWFHKHRCMRSRLLTFMRNSKELKHRVGENLRLAHLPRLGHTFTGVRR